MARRALIVLMIVAALLAAASMWNDSATVDEGAHLASGLLALTDGRLDVSATRAPLMEALAAAPVALAGYRVPEQWKRMEGQPRKVGDLLLHGAGFDPQRILRIARTPVIALFLALALLVYWFVAETTGNRWAGVAAAGLTAFCPAMLAHGRLATTDAGLALFAFLATALFLQLLAWPSLLVASLTGVATACALASSVSAAVLVPFFALLVILWTWQTGATPWRHLLLAVLTAVVAFAAVFMALSHSVDPLPAWSAYFDQIRSPDALPLERNSEPRFLLGEFSSGGWRRYNLVALAVKVTIPSLLVIVVGGLLAVRRARFEVVAGFLFAVLFLLASAFWNSSAGIRHVLPILPFLHAAGVIAIHDARRDANERVRRLSDGAVALLLGWHVVTSVLAFPSYISYFNPLIGSPRNADRILIGSDLDWGQDLRRLGQWTRDHGIGVMRVHYSGGGSVEREFGDRGERWTAPRPEPLPKGWFAVSRHFYRLSFDSRRSPMNYDDYLRASGAEFITSIGGSIDVYRVR